MDRQKGKKSTRNPYAGSLSHGLFRPKKMPKVKPEKYPWKKKIED